MKIFCIICFLIIFNLFWSCKFVIVLVIYKALFSDVWIHSSLELIVWYVQYWIWFSFFVFVSCGYLSNKKKGMKHKICNPHACTMDSIRLKDLSWLIQPLILWGKRLSFYFLWFNLQVVLEVMLFFPDFVLWFHLIFVNVFMNESRCMHCG
jgi:hypothetical protein